jgi:hypothetical protein
MTRVAGVEADKCAVGETGVDGPNGGCDEKEAEQTGGWQQSSDQ